MTAQDDLVGMPTDFVLPGDALDAVPSEKWAQALVQMVEVQEQAFAALGFDEQTAFRLARTGMLALAKYHGGQGWYLPRGDKLTTAMRDAEIYRRARRGNIPDLAKEFGLTDQQVWRIVRQQRALHIKKIQGNLFNDEGDKE